MVLDLIVRWQFSLAVVCLVGVGLIVLIGIVTRFPRNMCKCHIFFMLCYIHTKTLAGQIMRETLQFCTSRAYKYLKSLLITSTMMLQS